MPVDGMAGGWMNHVFFSPSHHQNQLYKWVKQKAAPDPVPESHAERLGGDITEMN